MRNLSFLFLLPTFFVTACGHGMVDYNVKPKQEPIYNFTQSSQVLSCLGSQINQSREHPIDVYVSNIPDHTTPTIEGGFLTKNAVMMVTTALDRLQTNKVAVIGKGGAVKSRRQVQILGSFTELNRTVQSNALSGETVFPGGFQLSLGSDKNANHIALDLAMSEQNRIVPSTPTSVSIQIHGNSGNATLTYDEGSDFAAIGAIGYSGQEGFHSGQRLLIETSVALMMSKYFDVDIRSCLNANKKAEKSEVKTDYDSPIFQRSSLGNASTTKARPNLWQRFSGNNALYSSDGVFADTSLKQLPETQGGRVVLPRGSQRQYLRAQPEEFTPNRTSSYSGVPPATMKDPANGDMADFLNRTYNKGLR